MKQGEKSPVRDVFDAVTAAAFGVMMLTDTQMQELETLCNGTAGMWWALKAMRKGDVPETAPELVADDGAVPGKTRIADCRGCWCDDCADIEKCWRHYKGQQPRLDTPYPCVGCMDGMRFRPKEDEPDCEYREGGGQNHG